MKKVLILANNSVGLYNFRFELIKELINQGNEVFFSLPESINDEKVKLLVESGAKHIQTYINRRGINPFEDLKLIKDYKKIIKDTNPDVILTYTIKPNVYGNYAANKYTKPVIMNITGIGTSLSSSKLKCLVKFLYKYACKKAKYVFFQNQSNYDFFVENHMADRNKAKIIPGSGVNIDKFKPLGKVKDDGVLRFLFIGRLMREKGIEEYLAAAEAVIKENENVEFQIVGPYEEDKYKDIMINIHNKRIVYLGISSDVTNQIREADCIVNPSYHEGMSNVLLEGAAMGKPLIASNIPGCKEIIEENYNGYLVSVKSKEQLKEKILLFIKLGKIERQTMGKNSRKKVENEFDRKLVVNQYINCIKNI